MTPAQSLTIVLPAFNEAERIGPALDELFGYLEHRNPVGRDGAPGAAALPDSIEVLVVDDGSSDNTADLVRARPETNPNPEAGTTLRVLVVPHAGKGAAVRTAIQHASGDFCVVQDADLEYDPAEYSRLLKPLLDGHADARLQPDPVGADHAAPRVGDAGTTGVGARGRTGRESLPLRGRGAAGSSRASRTAWRTSRSPATIRASAAVKGEGAAEAEAVEPPKPLPPPLKSSSS